MKTLFAIDLNHFKNLKLTRVAEIFKIVDLAVWHRWSFIHSCRRRTVTVAVEHIDAGVVENTGNGLRLKRGVVTFVLPEVHVSRRWGQI